MIYVVQCVAGKEYETQAGIEGMGYTVLMPRRQISIRKSGHWILRNELLFQAYVFVDICFCDGKLSVHDYLKIKSQNYVIRFLGSTFPEALPADEEQLIRWISNNGTPLEASSIALGEKIRVISGPLVGREGEIIDINPRQRRCKIRISTLGMTHDVSLSIDVIRNEQAQSE